MVEYGTPPPRTVIGDPSQGADSAETVRCSLARPLPSVCRTKDDALGQHAIAHEVPQGDQQLNHFAKVLSFWNLTKRHASWIIPHRTRALPET